MSRKTKTAIGHDLLSQAAFHDVCLDLGIDVRVQNEIMAMLTKAGVAMVQVDWLGNVLAAFDRPSYKTGDRVRHTGSGRAGVVTILPDNNVQVNWDFSKDKGIYDDLWFRTAPHRLVIEP